MARHGGDSLGRAMRGHSRSGHRRKHREPLGEADPFWRNGGSYTHYQSSHTAQHDLAVESAERALARIEDAVQTKNHFACINALVKLAQAQAAEEREEGALAAERSLKDALGRIREVIDEKEVARAPSVAMLHVELAKVRTTC